MANYLVSYDLNGPFPSHQQMDDILARVGARRGRVLETVWWVDYFGAPAQLRAHLQTILRKEDRLLVCKCDAAAWHNLLVSDAALVSAWRAAA